MAILDEDKELTVNETKDIASINKKLAAIEKKLKEVSKTNIQVSQIAKAVSTQSKQIQNLSDRLAIIQQNFDAVFQSINQVIGNQAVIVQSITGNKSGEKKKVNTSRRDYVQSVK